MALTGNDVRLMNAGNSTLVYYGPNGITGAFTYDKTVGNVNYYISPKAIKATLTRDLVSNTYAVTMHNSGDKYRFTLAGQLYKIDDRKDTNEPTNLNYTAGGALSSIVAEVGTAGAKTVTVDADPTSNRINGLDQSPSGAPARSVDYTYDPQTGQLIGITDVLGGLRASPTGPPAT